MNSFYEDHVRPHTGDVRFATPALCSALGLDSRKRTVRRATAAEAARLGAEFIRAGRVGRDNTMKDAVYSVPLAQWAEFWAGMEAWATEGQALPKEERPRAETQLDRIERMLASIYSRLAE